MTFNIEMRKVGRVNGESSLPASPFFVLLFFFSAIIIHLPKCPWGKSLEPINDL